MTLVFYPCSGWQTLETRDEVSFFQVVRAVLAKSIDGDGGKKSPQELAASVRRIVPPASASDNVLVTRVPLVALERREGGSIFTRVGLPLPEIEESGLGRQLNFTTVENNCR